MNPLATLAPPEGAVAEFAIKGEGMMLCSSGSVTSAEFLLESHY